MWSDYRIKENIINDFAVICKIIGEQGLLERRGDREYLTIQAPNGGKRSMELDVILIGSMLTDDTSYNHFVIKRHIIGDLGYASLDSTPFLELTDNDREYFSRMERKLIQVRIQESGENVICRN